ncbi:hypothetical protein BDV97DRAFT_365039 [Delphinella strobiligena]|nr:hypothetical protein BDV97DRAFT_365039 [Delphinella strobiligena]
MSRKRRKTSPTVQVSVEVSGLVQPRSLYKSIELKPLRLKFSEQQAHAELEKIWHSQDRSDQEYTIWKLDNFSVYRAHDGSRHGGEFVPLHRLTVDRGPQELLLDAVLCIGNEKRYVEGVPFSELTVEGYGDSDVTSLQSRICIRSTRCSKSSITVWYELSRPDPQYAPYYESYLWIAHLGKYFVDFLINTKRVTLNHFRARFYQFLIGRYARNEHFAQWKEQYPSTDFRQHVVNQIDYLWKECNGLNYEDDPELEDLTEHPL